MHSSHCLVDNDDDDDNDDDGDYVIIHLMNIPKLKNYVYI